MTSLIETIKAKVDVVEEIGLVVALSKSGKSFKGLCPFHNERTPSFYVFAESQTWRCFGCNEGGDIFTFVQKQQGLEFRETLHYLAEKAGVSVEDEGGRNPEEEREASAARERLRKLNEDALLWFHQMLLRSKEGSAARTYVQERGISADSVVAFGLGYAPEQWDSLSRYLLGRGYTEREMVSGGLARDRDGGLGTGGGVYDYFRHRLIFPIRDTRGRVIGFGGRAFGDDKPKYLNSPQTLLFEKNSVLYALDMARDAIKQAKQVVIVEGYVDAVIAHQYGTKQTVACIGSAITEKHIQQLKKLTKQVTLALDPDAAGEAATEHGIQEALKTFDRTVVAVPVAPSPTSSGGRKRIEPRGIIRLEEQVDAEINVLQLPPGEDPDEVIIHNFATWSYAVSHPLPLVDYYFMAKTAGLNLREPNGKAEAAKRLLPVIGMITDRIKRDAYLRKLSTMISIEERVLFDELQRVLRGQRSNSVVAQFSAPVQTLQVSRGGTAPLDARAPQSWDGERGKHGESEPDWIKEDEPGERGKREERQSSGGLDRRKENKLQWEDYLIGLLLLNPGLSPHVCGIINDGDFAGTDTRELYHLLNSMYQRGSSSLHEPLEQLVPSALLTTMERARKSVELRSPIDGEGLLKEAVQCATRLKRTRLIQLNTELQYILQEAKNTSDGAAVNQLMRKLLANQQQLRTIDSASHLQG
nr:DNA primase [Ktedonobacteraceae bacterium]